MHTYRDDYKCNECRKGTMKFKGELYASTYVLGLMWCDNPDCICHKENGMANLQKMIGEIKAKKELDI